MRITRRIAVASLMAMALAAPAFADDKPTILALRAGHELSLLRPHDERLEGRGGQAGRRHDRERRPGVLAQADRRRRGGAHQGRQRHRAQPERRQTPWRRRCRKPSTPRCRSSPSTAACRRVKGILGPCRRRQRQGRRGAGQSGRQDVPERRDDHQPAGPARREPGDRPQQGPAQRARQGQGQVQDRVRADRQLRPRPGPVGHRSRCSPAWRRRRDVIVAANDDMALGALEAVKAPQPQGQDRDHRLRRAARGARQASATAAWPATVEQFPGKQSATAVDILVDYHQDRQEARAADLVLLTPIVITKANLNKAERLNEVK